MEGDFADADKAIAELRNEDALRLLESRNGVGGAELEWRLARALYVVAENTSDAEAAKALFIRAHEHARKAVETKVESASVFKWAAITVGKLGDFSDTKSKIQNSFLIKEYALKAQELAPEDATLAHILGRWAFGVANISFVERTLASAIFASPPTATFEEALEHFLRHETLLKDKGGGMIRNKIFIGDTLLKLDRKTEAAEYFLKASQAEAKSESDRRYVEEAKKKHAEATKTGWW